MTDERRYSPETSGLLLAMTALQTAGGADPSEAFQRSVDSWLKHVEARGNDTWALEELERLVTHLTQ
jgi:hypothetical protein